ncbi:DUF2147 domain-containing protein [Methylobacterium sp. BTF04]|uniref:DUF2147 domain-containing protein n=1 Tax=Methylobacterium sp. BTF04 TaxID=2708300 RepID=UPI0013D0673A|nr:DUF2147 domain-containing protein [Methylobacterium sp. BTF04]NEU14110.1 DUF2147 domain-containing protein [Methylobacterium sp. BTF04]
MTPIIVRVATAVLVGLAAFSCVRSGPAKAADAAGTWLTEDGRARVRTEPCGPRNAHLCGYVVWGSKPLDETGKPKVDRYNPDPGKQTRALLGHQLILGLKPSEDGRHEGKIYNGDNGKSYDVTIWSETPTELSVRGCLLAVLCATQTWKRVTDVVPGQLTGATDTPGGPRSNPEWATKTAVSGSAPGPKGRPGDGKPIPAK